MVSGSYVAYKRREFCKDVKCPVQMELNNQTEGSPHMSRHARNAPPPAYTPHGSFIIGS